MATQLKQFKTKNFRGVLSLLAGNSIARVTTTLGGVLLANYYGPESFGIYNVFLSYILILSILSSFRIDSIMILLKDYKQIRNLFSGALLVILLSNFMIISGMSLLQAFHLVRFDVSYYVLFLCGIGSILTGWNLSQYYLFTKYKLFKQISFAFALASITSVAFQTLFYFIELRENGLIYGWMVGLAASFIYNIRVSRSRINKVNFKLLQKSIKKNIKIVKYTYPSDSINSIANNIMPILIVAYFTTTEVGVYAMAFKILSTPLVLLASAVGGVYFQRAANLYGVDNRTLEKLTYKVILSNIGLISLFVILMNTIGIYILELFFKEGWEELRAYLLALSFWIVARSAWSAISDLDAVLRRNQISLIFNIYLLAVNFVGLYYGVYKNDFIYSAWSFSILSGIGYLSLTGFVLYQLRKEVNEQTS
ncbi:MAG TPA: oligosaccharide flippase family protein [Brumimicrobium sp.]|nr:oligosaccharide flippase family protein [Brumimicrobium sp.]